MSIASIETGIVAILNTVTELNWVKDHEPEQVEKFPAATLFYSGFEQKGAGKISTETTYRWIVRLYVRFRSKKPNDSWDDLKALVPDVLTKFRNDPSLNSTCSYSLVESGEVFFLPNKKNPQLMIELNLWALKQES